jgi:hypothetical protein
MKKIAVIGALGLVLSVGLPKLMSTSGDAEQVIPRKGRAEPPQQHTELLRDRVAQRDPDRARESGGAAARRSGATEKGPAERVEVERVARAADDLGIALALRWDSYPAGAAIRATVEISNHDDAPVWVPSPGEPQRTLAIRVLDENGATVRHVVEEAADGLPRRMTRLGPGDSTTLELDVLAHGEKPLAPGRYQLAAVYEADKAWLRSGLPVWTAPKGARHADRVTFDVIER